AAVPMAAATAQRQLGRPLAAAASRGGVARQPPRGVARRAGRGPPEGNPLEAAALAVGAGLAAIGRAFSSLADVSGGPYLGVRRTGELLQSRLAADDSADPGRSGMAWEYLAKGEALMDVRLEHGGSLQVTSHAASERGPPPGESAGTRQEWRVLAFTPDAGTTDLVQSVTKAPFAFRSGGPALHWRLRRERASSHTLLRVPTVHPHDLCFRHAAEAIPAGAARSACWRSPAEGRRGAGAHRLGAPRRIPSSGASCSR
ncbi:unnamed protein product, partial [Prorocentrum cordatum]